MAFSELLTLLAALPAVLVGAARLVAAIAPAQILPAWSALLSPDAAVGSALLFGLAFAVHAGARLRRIERQLAFVSATVRGASETGDSGSAVVDFAIHLDRRREIALTAQDEISPGRGGHRPLGRLAAHPALSEVKSRLSDIPSVRRAEPGSVSES
jgi:hypothetical protein